MLSKTSKPHLLGIALAVASSLAFAYPLQAGIGGDEFDESTSPLQEDTLVWPEVSFPSAEQRGRSFLPGESFTFRAQWGIFSRAGRIQISTEALAPTTDNQNRLNIKLDTRSDGLIRRFYPLTLVSTTTLDADKWRVLRDEAEEKVRSKESRTLALFDYENQTVDYKDFEDPDRNKVREMPYEIALDYASFILQLRGWDMKVGDRYSSCVSTKGKFYFVEMQAMGKETVKTMFGAKTCFRVEPVNVYPQSKTLREGGKMAIWYSDDEKRIPVRLEVKTSVGTARMILEEYTLSN